MANMYTSDGAGPSKKKVKPGVAARNTAREKFVSENKASKGTTTGQARQRFYVQTRMAEMKAKGKTVTPEMRKQLQQKFQSGDVARKGFAAPAKKTGGSGSSSSAVSKVTSKVQPRTDTEGRMGSKAAPKVRSATSNMQGIRGYGRVDSAGRTGFGSSGGAGKSASKVDALGNAIRPKKPKGPKSSALPITAMGGPTRTGFGVGSSSKKSNSPKKPPRPITEMGGKSRTGY